MGKALKVKIDGKGSEAAESLIEMVNVLREIA